MRISDQRGRGSIIGVLFSLVAVAVLAVMALKSGGLLGLGGDDGEPDPMDQARIAAAVIELNTIKTGLGLLHRTGSFPKTSAVNSLDDLRAVLASTVPLQPDPAFTFVSYTSSFPDTFVLTTKAKDSARTLLIMTPTVGPKVADIQPSP